MSIDPATRGPAFPTTQWSLVLSAGLEDQGTARSALESLCRQYWYPLYHFVRRNGRAHHEAEDLTQQFLARVLETEGIATARPERGRFRTFLLTALRNFITDEWRQSKTVKRGGGYTFVPFEIAAAEERFAHEPVDQTLSPDQAFDRAWAVEMLERAMEQLRSEYASTGRGAVFATLAPRLLKARRTPHPSPVGLGNDHAMSMALTRLRHRLGLQLRKEIAATLADAADVDAELRILIGALGVKKI